MKPEPWQTGKPPNEVVVEGECPDTKTILRVKAFYGRDGYRPHWRSEDEGTYYSPHYFSRWRPLPQPTALDRLLQDDP